jgi:hypothetical protein
MHPSQAQADWRRDLKCVDGTSAVQDAVAFALGAVFADHGETRSEGIVTGERLALAAATTAEAAEQIGTPCQCIPREFLPTMTPQRMEAARSALANPFTTASGGFRRINRFHE